MVMLQQNLHVVSCWVLLSEIQMLQSNNSLHLLLVFTVPRYLC